MARYVTPFVVVNLGAEMVFVVAQRLQAQNIPHERSAFVLDEIISVLVSPQLINEISKPQAAYSHESVKNLIEDITQSSAMRLDARSMDKLWDLITMVFKWQLSLCTDIMKLTARHLYEIENYVTTEETQLQLHKIQNLFDNYIKILTLNEQSELRMRTLEWLQNYNVRVSLLLRLGLQDDDGNFIVDNLDSYAQDMLKNLGENIYSVTHNGKKDLERTEEIKTENEGFELKLLAEQIAGERKPSVGDNNTLKLSINHKNNSNEGKTHFVNIETNCNNLDNLFEELKVDDEGNDNIHDDLIEMIGQDN